MENKDHLKFQKNGRTRIRNKYGYIIVYLPNHPFHNKDNCIYEHRLVMEEHIGRYLTKNEVVHHKNHVRDDNRIENLELIDSNSTHMLRHELEKRIIRLQNISEIPKDTSNTSCFICNSTETHRRKDRNYKPAWRKWDGKPICETCRGRKRREKVEKIKEIKIM